MQELTTSTGEKILFTINKQNNWVFIRRQSKHQIENIEDCYHILPLIEFKRNTILNLLKGVPKSNKPKIEPNELYRMLLKFCIQSETHWGIKAISKLKSIDLDHELIELIDKLLDEKKYNQISRQTLVKIKNNR